MMDNVRFCGESRTNINQEISWQDHFQLGTKHFVSIKMVKLELGPRDELYLDIIFLISLSFIINEPICFFIWCFNLKPHIYFWRNVLYTPKSLIEILLANPIERSL